MKTVGSILIVGASVFAAGQAFDQPVGSPTPRVDLKNVHIVQKLGATIPKETQFKDRTGKTIQLADLLGKRPLVLLPIFYRCTGVCNLELQSLIRGLPKATGKIGKDFDVVVLSIDPNEGSDLAKAKCAAVLAADPAFKGTDAGWHFLTGTLASIRSLTDALGFYYTFEPQKDLINHPSGMMVITPEGTVSSYLLGADYDPGKITADIGLARKGKVGEKAADVFFGCVHIDPLTGRRSIVIEGVLRLAGLCTVVGIGGWLACLSIGKAKRRG